MTTEAIETTDTARLVRDFLDIHGLTQAALAGHLGVAQATVWRWLGGRRRTSHRMVALALAGLARELARPEPEEMRLYTLVCPLHGPVRTLVGKPGEPEWDSATRSTWRAHCRTRGCDINNWRIVAFTA